MATIYLSGPQGPQGAQGPQGPAGSGEGGGGSQGPQGYQGAAGSQGPQGEAGVAGSQGPQGEAGTAGSQGPQGESGTTGSQGPQGEAGTTGSQGPQGEAGSQGPQGDTGPQGPQGDSAGENFSGTYSATYVLSRTTVGVVSGDNAELTKDGSAPDNSGFTNLVTLSNNSTSMFDIMISARRTDADGEGAAFKISVVLDRNANAASTSLIGGDYKVIVARDSSSWDANVEADTTAGGLRLYVAGQAGKTIKWVAFVREIKSIE